MWLHAEVTNLARRGQRVYFTLVDDGGERRYQLDASMNATVFDRLAVKPKDGTQVHAYGRVEYWPQRSTVRLSVERLELTGDGLLLARIEELKQRLIAEGLTCGCSQAAAAPVSTTDRPHHKRRGRGASRLSEERHTAAFRRYRCWSSIASYKGNPRRPILCARSPTSTALSTSTSSSSLVVVVRSRT